MTLQHSICKPNIRISCASSYNYLKYEETSAIKGHNISISHSISAL